MMAPETPAQAVLARAAAPALAGGAGIWLFPRIDIATWPRELEAGGVVLLTLGLAALMRTGTRLVLARPDPTAVALARAGADGDLGARRSLEMAAAARTHLETIATATANLHADVRAAQADFVTDMTAYLDLLEHDPNAGVQGRELMRRLLPRLASAVTEYAALETRAADVLSLTDSRARIIGALERAGAAARAARVDTLSGDATDVDVELSVLEDTLSRMRS